MLFETSKSDLLSWLSLSVLYSSLFSNRKFVMYKIIIARSSNHFLSICITFRDKISMMITSTCTSCTHDKATCFRWRRRLTFSLIIMSTRIHVSSCCTNVTSFIYRRFANNAWLCQEFLLKNSTAYLYSKILLIWSRRGVDVLQYWNVHANKYLNSYLNVKVKTKASSSYKKR